MTSTPCCGRWTVANPTDALLTEDERAFVRRMKSRLPLPEAICRAQHAKTLRWVADRIEPVGGDMYLDTGMIHRRATLKGLADELRALADGRGEG